MKAMRSLLSTLAVRTLIGGIPVAAPLISGSAGPQSACADTVCVLPGVLSSTKIPADTTEVANDCSEAGSATVVRAVWWGGY